MNLLRCTAAVCVVASSAATGIAPAAVLRVPEDQPTIQVAIDAAHRGDTVLVGPGEYFERILLRDLSLTVASHFLLDTSDSALIENTIIDADTLVLGRADSGSVVTCVGEHDTTTALLGLTLTGGIGLLSPGGQRYGGGVYCEAEISITDCRIRHNVADLGAAITIGDEVTATLQACRIDSNTSLSGGPIHVLPYNFDAHLVISNSRITDNMITAASANLYGRLTIDSCQINDQGLQSPGGGASRISRSRLERCALGGERDFTLENDTLVSCTLRVFDHLAVARRCRMLQTRIEAINASAEIDSCLITGALDFQGSYPVTVARSTIVSEGDVAIRYSGIFRDRARASEIRNPNPWLALDHCVFVTAGEPVIDLTYWWDPVVYLRCCDVYGFEGPWFLTTSEPAVDTAGVLFEDPQFCDPAGGDFRLQSTSPCLPENSGCGLVGAHALGCGGQILDSLWAVDEVRDHVVSHQPTLTWGRASMFAQAFYEIEVGADSEWSVSELWQPGPQAGTDSLIEYSGSDLADGGTYQARVRISDGSLWSRWREATLRLNSLPTAPTQISPAAGHSGGDNPPRLLAVVGADAENDSQHLQFAVIQDDSIVVDESPFLPAGAAAQGDTVEWTGAAELLENGAYVWIARSTDGYETTGYWAAMEHFFVNTIEEPPFAPQLTAPVPASIVYSQVPLFLWINTGDPDPGDLVRYTFEIALNSLFTPALILDSLVDTGLVLPTPLELGTQYWWRVFCFDSHDLGDTSQVAAFKVYLPGDVNVTNAVSPADIITLVNYVFKAQAMIVPECTGKVNGDGVVNSADIIHLINFVFKGGAPPLAGCE
jgi:hypothetical protein